MSVVNSHLLVGASLALTDLSVVDPCFWEVAPVLDRYVIRRCAVHVRSSRDRVGFEHMALSEPALHHAGRRAASPGNGPVRLRVWAGNAVGTSLCTGRRRAARMGLPAAGPSGGPPQHAIGVPVPGGAFLLVPVLGRTQCQRARLYRPQRHDGLCRAARGSGALAAKFRELRTWCDWAARPGVASIQLLAGAAGSSKSLGSGLIWADAWNYLLKYLFVSAVAAGRLGPDWGGGSGRGPRPRLGCRKHWLRTWVCRAPPSKFIRYLLFRGLPMGSPTIPASWHCLASRVQICNRKHRRHERVQRHRRTQRGQIPWTPLSARMKKTLDICFLGW